MELWDGQEFRRGNCSDPNTCTCLCKERSWKNADQELVEEPWVDPLNRELPPGFIFGTQDCLDGFEGLLRPHRGENRFQSCHLGEKCCRRCRGFELPL